MRIISGKYKSRSLIAPQGDQTRPTSDRARESLFNVLQNLIDFEGMNVLDLFAGSGAFGFEALSRGASHATLIEESKRASEAIMENAKNLEATTEITLIKKDVYKWLENPPSVFDLILADPPYDDARTLERLPEAIFSSRLLTPDSVVIIEHRKGSRIKIPRNAMQMKELQAGEAVFTILSGKA